MEPSSESTGQGVNHVIANPSPRVSDSVGLIQEHVPNKFPGAADAGWAF